MKRLYYDLHIHSCLSPCGDSDMTPNNIVNMARLKGLDVIAVTDHNAIANSVATAACAAGPQTPGLRTSGAQAAEPLLVLYGAEIETAEEVHVLCLFAEEGELKRFWEELGGGFPQIENRKEIYGDQVIMDEADRVVGEELRLLAGASTLSFEELFWLTDRYGGAFVPAHIDKEYYSVLSNLGFLPPALPIATVEVSTRGVEKGFVERNQELLSDYRMISSSDAHYLWDIAEPESVLIAGDRSGRAVIRYLRGDR